MHKGILGLSCAILLLLGSSDSFAQKANKQSYDYGSNVIRIAPLSALDIGVGFGISYERLLGKEKMVGLILPFNLILENKDSWGMNESEGYNNYLYLTPGIKVYPGGSQKKVSYAVGPTVMMAFGGGSEWRDSNDPWGSSTLTEKSVFRLGMLVNNYLNFQLSQNVNMGLELGLGVRYLDNVTYTKQTGVSKSNSNGFQPTGQFSFTFGYRF